MATRKQAPPSTVMGLRRPPVRQSTMVRSDVGHTFDTFVRTIGVWWPVTPFSVGQERVRDVTFERRPGGRVLDLGRRNPGGLGHAAHLGAAGAVRHELEHHLSHDRGRARFTALGPALTRVPSSTAAGRR